MADKSAIEWTDASWNPVVGCSIVSPGCTNCYAMAMAARIEKMQPRSHYAGTTRMVKAKPVWTGKLALAPDHILIAPLRWKRPRRIFVNSMGDLFHEDVPDAWIAKVFNVMAECPHHRFQLLTKRAARMRKIMNGPKDHDLWSSKLWHRSTLPNVWLGVSCEDQARANERIPDLRATPAAVRFVSAEPLLGRIDFTEIYNEGKYLNALSGENWLPGAGSTRSQTFEGAKLDWIIAGGESGPGARPMHPDWARAIRDQCAAAGTSFHFKQWGEHLPCVWDDAAEGLAYFIDDGCAHQNDLGMGRMVTAHDREYVRLGKKRAGRLLDGIEHNGFPK